MPHRNPAPVVAKPVLMPLPHAPSYYGLSRSTIYRAAAAGRISLKKVGRSTLVETASMRAYLASLPAASLRRAA